MRITVIYGCLLLFEQFIEYLLSLFKNFSHQHKKKRTDMDIVSSEGMSLSSERDSSLHREEGLGKRVSHL